MGGRRDKGGKALQAHRGPVQDGFEEPVQGGFKELSTEQFCLRQSVSVIEEVTKIHTTMQKITAV